MRRALLPLALLAVAAASASAAAQTLPDDLTPYVRILYKHTAAPTFFPMGSGTVVTPEGLILTNEHVFNVPDSVATRLGIDPSVAYIGVDHDRDRHTAVQVRYRAAKLAYWYSAFPGEPDYDVAVMLITHTAEGAPVGGERFVHARLGNPFALPDGAEMTFLGFPGVGGANLANTPGTFSHYLEGGMGEIPDGALFVSGSVWGGNSGGAAIVRDDADGSWRVVGIPTWAGPGRVYVHPVTWAGPLFRFVERRMGVDAPEIPSAWARSKRNRDRWTRERSIVSGTVTDPQGRPVQGALVFLHPEARPWETVVEHANDAGTVPFVDLHGEQLVFAVASTDDAGYFESWIDAGATFAVRIHKQGFRPCASGGWKPGSALSQVFEDPFRLEPAALTAGGAASGDGGVATC